MVRLIDLIFKNKNHFHKQKCDNFSASMSKIAEHDVNQSKRMRLGSDTSSDYNKVTNITCSTDSSSDLFPGQSVINLD